MKGFFKYLTWSIIFLALYQAYRSNKISSLQLPSIFTKPVAIDSQLPFAVFPVAGAGVKDIISDWDDLRGDRLHQAIDIQAPRGTHALAVSDGIIHRVSTHELAGLYVVLHDPARDFYLYYAHLDKQLVREGQRVSAGDILGKVGDTGNAKGTVPHLHFAIRLPDQRKIDPMPYVQGPSL